MTSLEHSSYKALLVTSIKDTTAYVGSFCLIARCNFPSRHADPDFAFSYVIQMLAKQNNGGAGGSTSSHNRNGPRRQD